MTIDHTQLTQFNIDLSQCVNAAEIKGIMKDLSVEQYVYSFIYKNEVLKFGHSMYVNDRDDYHGERIYRQARYISGWPTMPATKNSSGSDILPTLEYFPEINKNQVVIHVWDMTNYNWTLKSTPRYDLILLENQLIEEHRKIMGCLPIGNIKSESHIKSKYVISDKRFNELFEIVE